MSAADQTRDYERWWNPAIPSAMSWLMPMAFLLVCTLFTFNIDHHVEDQKARDEVAEQRWNQWAKDFEPRPAFVSVEKVERQGYYTCYVYGGRR